MKANEQRNPLSVGFISGILVALIAWGLVQTFRESRGGDVIAEIQNEKLTTHELRRQKANEFVPVENDEYRILKQGAEEWLNGKLFEKEAKAQGISVEELYKKDLWSQVHPSSTDVADFYNANRELFEQPFEQVSSQIAQELRRKDYARVKNEYLEKLRKKYNAKILLSEPKSYVEGLAVPYDQVGTGEPSQPAPPSAEQGEAPAPPQPVVTFDDLEGRPSQGPKNAAITLVEFSDFHCPFCSRVGPTMEQLMEKYKGRIRRVWRHYPLPMHPGAERTHEASECASEQGKFWEYHDKLFATQGESREDSALIDLAKQTGLDASKFQQCLTSEKYKETVQKDFEKGSSAGVEGTPSVFVNGELVAGAYPLDHFVNIIEGKLNPGQAPPAPAAQPEPEAPQQNVQFDDLDGKPSQGPKNAAITLVEFSDFHCPFCSRVGPTMEQLMEKYKGKIRRVWRHYPLPMHPGADRTHEASQCAADQNKFWEYHDKLFATQSESRDDKALIDLAKQVGVNQSKFQECLTSGKYKNLIQQEVAKGAQLGVQGTPSVFVNGEMVAGAYPFDYFVNTIEKKLNPGQAPNPAAAPKPAAQPQAANPGTPVAFNDLDDKPSQGPKNAPITLIEFSDFHCPFCARVGPTINQLMSNYKGKIRRVWRHYPLPMHSGADRTHQASQCAAEQGKFWEYHDKLFSTQGGQRDDNALNDLAKQVGLKEKKFKECLTSGKYKNLIQQEVAKGSQVGVRGTPSFFVNGQLVVGAKPYASFDQIIQSELNKAKS